MFLQNFVSFYQFINKFYDNKLGGPVIMKHRVYRVNRKITTFYFLDTEFYVINAVIWRNKQL